MKEKNESQNVEHAVKFFLFSVSAGIIQALSFTLIYELMEVQYWPAYLVALTLSVLWNFTLNRKYTFKSAANVPVAMFKVAVFYMIFTPLSTWAGSVLSDTNISAYLILGPTMFINFVGEFVYTKYYVYRNQINTALINENEVLVSDGSGLV